MFSVPPGSVRGSNERVVIEIIAALQMSFFVTVPAIVLWLKFWRDVVSRSERWTFQGCFTMILWWTPYLYDVRGAHSPRSLVFTFWHFLMRLFFFFRSRLSDYLCKCCTVWSRDTHFALSRLKVSCPQVLVRIWNLLSVLGCDNVPVMIFAFFVLYGFCDEHHTTKIWEAFVDKWWLAWWKLSTCVFVTEPVIALVLKQLHVARCTSVMNTHHTTRIFGGQLHTSLVDMEFSCLRRGASDDHCDICRVWSCDTYHWPSHL